MNAFEFGWRMHKVAVGPAVLPGQQPSPREFPIPDYRSRLSRLTPEAFQHAGIQPYNPEWSSRQVWDAAQAIQSAPAVKIRAGMSPATRDAVQNFNSTRTWTGNTMKRTAAPIFAPPGSPAARRHVPISLPRPAQPPAPAPAAPQLPAQPVQRVPAPAAGPAGAIPMPQNAVPGWKLGDPVPAGHVVNDQNVLVKSLVKPGPLPQVPRNPIPQR